MASDSTPARARPSGPDTCPGGPVVNATSRALCQTLLTSDSTLTPYERIGLERLLAGEPVVELPTQPLLLTQKQTAVLLSVNRVTVWLATREGVLPVVEILPGLFRYRLADVQALARCEEP